MTSANLCRWVINYRQLQIEKKIGTGTYGMVYRAKWKGVDVAVKVRLSFIVVLEALVLKLTTKTDRNLLSKNSARRKCSISEQRPPFSARCVIPILSCLSVPV